MNKIPPSYCSSLQAFMLNFGLCNLLVERWYRSRDGTRRLRKISLTFPLPALEKKIKQCDSLRAVSQTGRSVSNLLRIKRIHHWCSVGTGKSQPEGPPFQWETRLRRVSHWNGGPSGWDFPVPLYTNDRFYFSHI